MTIASSTSIKAYRLCKGGSYARMAILRMIAADSVNNRNEATRLQPGDWRSARHWTMANYAGAYGTLSQGFNGKTPVWYCHTGEQFRNERDAHIVARLDHTGWYCDPDQGNLCIGIVASLPHGRFIAGYRLSETDERVYFPELFDDEKDAALMADEHARVYGEAEYAYQELWREARDIEQEIESNLENLRELRQTHSAVIIAYSVSRNSTVSRKRKEQASSIRDDAAALIETIREAREKLADSRFDDVREG